MTAAPPGNSPPGNSPPAFPNPDPTERTREDLLATIAAERKITDKDLAIRDERIDAIDEATKLRLQIFDQIPQEIAARVDALKALMEERLASVGREFELVERGRVEQKVDTKAAVDAALIAQKEAVKEQTTASERAIAKSEAATTKQIDELNKTFTTLIDGVRREMVDLKDRQAITDSDVRASGAGSAGRDQKQQENTASGVRAQSLLIGLGGLALTAIIVVLAIIAASGNGGP